MDAIQICLLLIYVGMILAVLSVPVVLTIVWLRISAKLKREQVSGVKVEEMPRPKPAIITPFNPVSGAKAIGSHIEYAQRNANPLPKPVRIAIVTLIILTAVLVVSMFLVMAVTLLFILLAAPPAK